MSEINELPEMETLFLALADKTRLRLLNLLREKEVCVCWLTVVLGESQPKISRHLAYLRGAGIVSARRDGKWINYRLESPVNRLAAEVLRNTLDWLESQEEMRLDFQRLANVTCVVEAPLTITERQNRKYSLRQI